MFLQHIANLGFLTNNPESSVFLSFPDNTRKVIAIKLCNDLLANEPPPEKLSNSAHVRVLMECIGQTFSLPIDVQTIVIIDKARQVYHNWLFDSASRPPPIQEDEQIFFKDIFKHYSSLFSPHASAAMLKSFGGSGAGVSDDGSGSDDTMVSALGSSNNLPGNQEENYRQVIAQHSKVCHTILDAFQEVGRKLNARLTTDTWEHLLRIILGISDSLLSLPEGDSYLADDLAPKLLEVLFELFLTSRTDSTVMWDHLKRLVNKWRHRVSVIHQWGATVYGITQNVLYFLYGQSIGTSHVQIVLPHLSTVDINGLSRKYVFYAWYRMLHLLGDLESIPSSENYLEAMHYISKLSVALGSINPANVDNKQDVEMNMGSPTSPSKSASTSSVSSSTTDTSTSSSSSWTPSNDSARKTDGNTILHIVGPWLFSAINNYQKGYEKGKASAIESLAYIFCSNPTTEFDPSYLAYFYNGLEAAFKTKNNLLVSVILTKTTSFFQCEFRGSHILIPSYIEAIERFLLQTDITEGISTSITQLRKACLKIVGCMLCFSNQFKGVKFFAQGKPSSYKLLYKQLANCLTTALENEIDEQNQQLIMWTSVVLIVEEIQNSSKFAVHFINRMLGNILTDRWSNEVCANALQILGDLESFSEVINAKSKYARMLVSKLCTYIENHMNREKAKSEPVEDLIVNALIAAMRWVMAGQWIVRDEKTLAQVLHVIEVALTGKFNPNSRIQEYYQPSKKIHEAGELFFIMLFFHNGQFPTKSSDPSFNCSLESEHDVAERYNLSPHDHVDTYIYDSTFISVVRHPRSKNNAEVRTTVILRNNAGRWVWQGTLNYFPHPVLEPPALPDPVPPSPGDIPSRRSSLPTFKVLSFDDEQFNDQLLNLCTPEQKAVHEQLLDLASKLHEQEKAIAEEKLASSLSAEALAAAAVSRPKLREEIAESPVGMRLFLSHLGFSSIENATRFAITKSPDADSKFNMVNLDKQNSRQCYAINVVYLRNNQTTTSSVVELQAAASDDQQQQVDHTKALSDDYHTFLETLGWYVDLEHHNGFKGGLTDTSKTGRYAPYYADCVMEVLFQVETLWHNITEKEKRKLLQSCKVVITWSTDHVEANPDFLRSAFVNIVVQPLQSKLYRIRIFRSTGLQNICGPLLDDMVVSKHILGLVVRQTAVNFSKMLGKNLSGPISLRNMMIKDLRTGLRDPQPISKFYASSQFPSLSSSNIASSSK
mmetsp:Transcript_20722/g.30812  ORF Transcript_20722/g.30812 Transcript_20722/m.30812 type:complete len:1224 (+) Transcript_20722:40-3711(+)